jgi:phage gp46-like protein
VTASDIAIVWDAERTAGDWQLTASGELLTAGALESAVMVSLFTDARAQPDDRLPPGETDRRGWWGNALGDDPIGSRLWLLRRAKQLPDTLRLAEDYIREALAWLVADGLAARVEVSAEWVARSRIGARISIVQGEGSAAALRAEWAWQGI